MLLVTVALARSTHPETRAWAQSLVWWCPPGRPRTLRSCPCSPPPRCPPPGRTSTLRGATQSHTVNTGYTQKVLCLDPNASLLINNISQKKFGVNKMLLFLKMVYSYYSWPQITIYRFGSGKLKVQGSSGHCRLRGRARRSSDSGRGVGTGAETWAEAPPHRRRGGACGH